MYRKIVCFCVAMCVLLPLIGGIMTENFTVNAEGTMAVTSVDGVNVTRWADMLIVYKDIATTGQNEWGYNVVVDSSGVVTQIIEGGDIRGKDLAVPSGGMVVSATGARVDWLKENIKAGDYVCFDDVTCRIMVSEKNEFDISFVQSLGITHFNEPRYSGRVVVYDVSGTTTQTNGYGYEIVVSAEGVIIGSGGNDNTVPQGGYVVSAIEPADKTLLKTCGVVGAQCLLDRDSMKVTIVYDEESILRWAQMRIDTIRSLLGQAKENLQLIDYEKAEEAISKAEEFMNTNDITTYAGRSELSMMFDEAQLLLYESKGVELRAVWYSPLERNESGVKEVVQTLADNGINQLCLGVSNGRDTIIPLPDNFPFRQRASLRGFDLLKAYIDECKKHDIELVICLSVFHNSQASADPEWLSVANVEGETEASSFYSPASEDFVDYLYSYISYIIENYDIDGLQLDYIRYPYFDGTVDYGYDDITKEKFANILNIDVSEVDEIGRRLSSHPLWDEWVNFKEGLVTDVVRGISELVREKRPDIYLSACIAGDFMLQNYCQDVGAWLAQDLLDAIYPMSYAEGIMASHVRYFTDFDGDYFCFGGSGSYLSFSKEEQLRQVLETREYGAEGISFFELGAYIDHLYAKYLKKSAFSLPALSPTYRSSPAAVKCIETAKKRICENAVAAGYVSAETAAQFAASADKLTSLADDLNPNDITELLDVISVYSSETWYSTVKNDIELAAKIIRLSKDQYKNEDNPGASADESASVSDDSSAISGEKNTVWILSVGAIVTLVAAAVCVGVMVIKKKKSSSNR